MGIPKEHKTISKLDMLGFSASTICAIHCATIPVILLFLPLIGLEFITDPFIEIALIGLSLIVGVYTLTRGYLRHHRRIYPIILFIAGLAIIAIGHFAFGHELHEGEVSTIDALGIFGAVIIPVGAIMIAIAHYMNRKMCLSCKVDHDHEHVDVDGHTHSHIRHHHESAEKLEASDVI
jgi:ABC-type nickel/cobalt efflux system permease component RcnA